MSFSKEKKRTRGEIACAECRRLKTRCDKRMPCSTCVRRGCEMLCPNSTMPAGERSRFVTVAKEFLHRKMLKMEERMRLLEDALVIIQAESRIQCPPMTPDGGLLARGEIEWTLERDGDSYSDGDSDFSKYGLVEIFGSLYLDDKGPHPHGPALLETSGSSESLLLRAKALVVESSAPASNTEDIGSSCFPEEIKLLHQAFPFTPSGILTEPVQDLIESYLPPFPHATALCETFLQSMSWIFNVVSRQHILGELVPAVYSYTSGQTPKQLKSYGPHDIALLFIVFALGALVDPSLPPHSLESQHYHTLSRAAICLQSVLAQHSVMTIKLLNLMSIYNAMCGTESKLGHSFSLLDLAARVALQIGIHRDPSAWGITGREAYDRRTYFWNLLSGILWQSLISGHPPVIISSLIDCHIPTEEEEDMYQSNEAPLGFGVWSFSFTIQCLVPVVEATQGVRRPDYDAILALDAKIRGFSIPQASSTLGQMQTSVRTELREITLLFLHRSFFAQALADFPQDPLKSPFRQSFFTAYQSATRVLNTTRKQFAQQPALSARVWRIWSFAFSAAVIIGAVAITRSSIHLEPEPFQQLELACILFREAACMNARAQNGLLILLRLKQEATQVRLEEAGSPEGIHDLPRTFVDSSGLRLLTPHQTYCMPRAGAPTPSSSKHTETHLVSVLHPPLPRAPGCNEEPSEGTAGAMVRFASQGEIHGEIPSLTSPAAHGMIPTANYAHGIELEEPWATFKPVHHTGTGTHTHPP